MLRKCNGLKAFHHKLFRNFVKKNPGDAIVWICIPSVFGGVPRVFCGCTTISVRVPSVFGGVPREFRACATVLFCFPLVFGAFSADVSNVYDFVCCGFRRCLSVLRGCSARVRSRLCSFSCTSVLLFGLLVALSARSSIVSVRVRLFARVYEYVLFSKACLVSVLGPFWLWCSSCRQTRLLVRP